MPSLRTFPRKLASTKRDGRGVFGAFHASAPARRGSTHRFASAQDEPSTPGDQQRVERGEWHAFARLSGVTRTLPA